MAAVIEKTGGPIEYKEIDVAKPAADELLINIKCGTQKPLGSWTLLIGSQILWRLPHRPSRAQR